MEKNKQQKLFLISLAVFAFLLIFISLFLFSRNIRADEITDSEEISVTAYVPPDNILIFSGKACPACRAYLEQDGVPASSDICNGNAEFQITIEDIPAGTYLYEVYAIDTDGIYSSISPFTITVSASQGVVINTSDILLSPTLQSDVSSVTQGDDITFSGQTVPSSVVTIVIDGNSPFVQVNSVADGGFYYIFDSSSLDIGSHSAEARVTDGGIISPYSLPMSFEVEEEEEEGEEEEEEESACGKADYSDDDKVGLVDFSILLHWYGDDNVPNEIDLDSDDKADLVDFSILLYCWDE